MVFGTIRSAHACIALGQMHRFFRHGGAIPHCILPYISLNYIKQLWKSFLGKSLFSPDFFPNHSFFTLFRPCSFHDFQRTPDSIRWPCVVRAKKGKKRLVVTCFVVFFFEGFRTSPLPLECFLLSGNPIEWHSTWLSLGNVPNLSCFPLFLPSSFQQEAFGCDCFFHVLSCFCAGWVVVAATCLFEGFRTSHIPLEFFLTWRYPTQWD